MQIKWIKTGVTRWVLLIGPWAIKFPKSIRGWLANQSEWRQRKRKHVNPPLFTLFHFATVYKRAQLTGWWKEADDYPFVFSVDADEEKPSSWGLIFDRWLLIDFDRAWEEPRRGIVNRIYYWNQERLARKWMKLPQKENSDRIGTGPRCVP